MGEHSWGLVSSCLSGSILQSRFLVFLAGGGAILGKEGARNGGVVEDGGDGASCGSAYDGGRNPASGGGGMGQATQVVVARLRWRQHRRPSAGA